MPRQLSGGTHEVFTAVAVARAKRIDSAVEIVSVTFRELRDDEIVAVMGLSLVRLVTLLGQHGVSYDFRGVRLT